jgi:hypothetical protein
MSTNSHVLSSQWATRPSDERFVSVNDLHAFNVDKRQRSLERGVALEHMQVMPTDDGGMLLGEKGSSKGAYLTNWAFGQLCQRASAPAGYLRSLPSQLAVIPLQWSLDTTAKQDATVLLRKNGTWTSDAITSSTYGRIYDSQVSGAILQNMDLTQWKVPAASYASSDPKRATTLYASDRDMFVCLVNDSHPVEVPGANGADTLYRGFIIRNSEVGAAALDISLFLYRYICDNRIIWGMSHERSLKIRHTSGGPMRFVRDASPTLIEYAQASTRETVEAVLDARKRQIGNDVPDVVSWLRARGFTQEQGKAAVANAEKSGDNPRSLWGVVQGLTATAHEMPFGDERFEFERKAGKLLPV